MADEGNCGGSGWECWALAAVYILSAVAGLLILIWEFCQ